MWYQLIQSGKVVDRFPTFTDAWIHATNHLTTFAHIVGPKDRYYPDGFFFTFNPKQVN